MKLVVTKDALLEGLQRTQNVVSNRPTVAILSNVLLETTDKGLRLTTTDLNTTIRCEIPAQVERPGSTTLPVRRFAAIVRELFGGEISIETDSKNITSIRCATSFFKIFGLPKEEFPQFPELQDAVEIVIPQSCLRDGLKRTSYAISMDETRYVLNGILFSFKENKFTLVSTDGRRLALYETEIELPRSQEREFIVPTKAIIELQRVLNDEDRELHIWVSPNIVAFHLSDTLLISKLVEGNYPNYRQVIPEEIREKIKLEREVLLNTVRRVSLLSVDRTSSVRLTFSNNNLDIVAITPEIGEARESLPIPYKGKDFSIAFNPEFLMDPLRNVPDNQIDLDIIDEMSPGVIRTPTGSNFLYVLMPMRVSV